jgi:ubiquitin-conjugating enzyme E2 Q
MDLLTDTKWSPAYTAEAVIILVRLALTSSEPAARLDNQYGQEYGMMEAMDAFERVAGTHGWKVGPNWRNYLAEYNK